MLIQYCQYGFLFWFAHMSKMKKFSNCHLWKGRKYCISRTRTHEYGFFFYIITPTRPTAYAEHHAGGLFLCPSQESYPHFSSPYQAPWFQILSHYKSYTDLLCVCQVPRRNFWVIFKCTVIYLHWEQGM